MMEPLTESSLGRRLSIWLAAFALLSLAVVSVTVYLLIADHLSARQAAALDEKRRLVHHLVTEARRSGNNVDLMHRLDDFLVGHSDLVLILTDSSNGTFYDSTASNIDVSGYESVAFAIAPLPGTASPGTATLYFDGKKDSELLARLAITSAAVSLFGAMLVSMGVFWLVRRGLRPVEDLARQTVQLSAATLDSRLDGSAQPTELQPLIQQFNLLLERLARSYEQLESFNADVAHELNTPLTTLITSTELALRRRRDSQSVFDLLGSNLEELHRMSQIINDMLFLSRANHGSRARRVLVDSLAGIALEVIDYHEALFADLGINVEIVGEASGDFDVPLIKRALSNLLGNASRYATAGTDVQISIEQISASQVQISVINSGETIPESHQARLFDRFYRADSSRTEAQSHHGLGLSIVAGIARMHDGEPFVQSVNETTRIGFSATTV